MITAGKLFLLPISLLYGLVVSIRNIFYNKNIFKSTSFPMPIISVGNLTTGGTGKTPHIEYLIRLLSKDNFISTLSRGYGRKTRGFKIAEAGVTAADIGDEPLQYYKKFDNITVCVGEKRVSAVKKLMVAKPNIDVILLDDAYQHRSIVPGLNILLTDYSRIFTNNFLLPTGTLRECVGSMKRADIIVVSKCPAILSPLERRRIESEIKPMPHQQLYYSYLKYGEFLPTWETQKMLSISKDYYFERNYSVLLVTGIANPSSIENYLKERAKSVTLLQFPDHHKFTAKDLQKIQEAFDGITKTNKIIITTEKDTMRLSKPEFKEAMDNLRMFYLPIEVVFHDGDKERFNQQIEDYVGSYTKETGEDGGVLRKLIPSKKANKAEFSKAHRFGIF